MNPLAKKEIRLLLPSWLAILSLEALLPWLWRDASTSFAVMPFIVFMGMILLAVDSFGRECNLGTFQSLLSQPIERRQIWRIKISTLFLAAVLILAAYFASCGLRLHQALTDSNSVWHFNSTFIESDFRNAMFGSLAAMLVALAGGLWTALLFRQAAAAFWVSFVVPAGLLVLIAFVMSKFFNPNSDVVGYCVLYGAAGLYTVCGYWLAHRLFHHAQDVGWSGGTVSFSSWRYFDAGSNASVSARRRKPFIALLKKEFQLQSISLFCAGALLILHIGVFFLRVFHAKYGKDSLAANVSDFFCLLWLFIPLVIGCTAVAEERRLGVMEGQCCLPVSRRVQFAIKGLLVLLLGAFLGGVMPMLLEGIAAFLGAPNSEFHFNYRSEVSISAIAIIGFALGLSLAGFYASTLAKSFLQAVGIAVGASLGGTLFATLAGNLHSFMGVTWNPALTICISILTILLMVLWLTYSNFMYFQEWRRVWQRNVFSVTGAMLFILVSSAALYNRVWEVFESAEPPHGTPTLSMSARPTFQSDTYVSLLVRLVDGRVWFDSLEQDFYLEGRLDLRKVLRWLLFHPRLRSAGPQQFIDGSNWVSVTARHIDLASQANGVPGCVGNLDTVGTQPDGTLWISSEAKAVIWTGAKMIRLGDETNWQQVVRSSPGFLLLKMDGTLWQWGTNRLDWSRWQTNWPTVRASKPQQIGTDSDWKEIINRRAVFARKADGSTWKITRDWKTGEDVPTRRVDLDQIVPETFSWAQDESMAYIGKDGTLWIAVQYPYNKYVTEAVPGKFSQVSKDTNWVTVAMNWNCMVTLKADGTLWKWDFPRKSNMDVAEISPIRLGIHRDWVALTGTWGGAISLAADGSLWFWPNAGYYQGPLLKTPKQPQSLGNIFSGTH